MQRLRTDGFAGAVQGSRSPGYGRPRPVPPGPDRVRDELRQLLRVADRLELGDTRTRVTDHAPAAVLWLPESLKKFFRRPSGGTSDTGEVSYIHMDPEWNWLFQKLIPGGVAGGFVSPLADPRKNAFDFAARAPGS